MAQKQGLVSVNLATRKLPSKTGALGCEMVLLDHEDVNDSPNQGTLQLLMDDPLAPSAESTAKTTSIP